MIIVGVRPRFRRATSAPDALGDLPLVGSGVESAPLYVGTNGVPPPGVSPVGMGGDRLRCNGPYTLDEDIEALGIDVYIGTATPTTHEMRALLHRGAIGSTVVGVNLATSPSRVLTPSDTGWQAFDFASPVTLALASNPALWLSMQMAAASGGSANEAKIALKNTGSTVLTYVLVKRTSDTVTWPNTPASPPTGGTQSDVQWLIRLRYRPTPLSAPSLSATGTGARSVQLSITRGDARTTHYRITRDGSDIALIRCTGALQTWDDVSLVRGESYTYTVTAIYKTVSATSAAASDSPGSAAQTWRVFTPTALSASSTVVAPYAATRQSGVAPVITGLGTPRIVDRRFEWSDLESAEGVYDFSGITAIRDALSADQRLHFRVRCVVPGQGRKIPAYLTASDYDIAAGDYIPRWANAYIQTRLAALATALAAAFDGDTRISAVDNGLYGDYGEWSEASGWGTLYGASDATKQAIVDLWQAAFVTKRTYYSIGGSPALVAYLAAHSSAARIGLRQDGAGNPSSRQLDNLLLYSQSQAGRAFVMQCVRDGRVIAEPFAASGLVEATTPGVFDDESQSYRFASCGDNNWATPWGSWGSTAKDAIIATLRVSGARLVLRGVRVPASLASGEAVTLTSAWRNVGRSLPPEAPTVAWHLRDGGGGFVASAASSLDLRHVRYDDGDLTHTDSVTFTAPAGTYTLGVQVGAGQYDLAIAGQQSGNWYALGTVTIV